MRMTTAKIILALLLICLIGFGTFVYLNPDGLFAYGRFQRQSSSYYSQLAHACDSLLQQHKAFSKHAMTPSQDLSAAWMDANNVLWDAVKILGNDPSLPKPVRSLHAKRILIEPNRVLIEIGLRPDFVIIWGRDEMQTNTWTLVTNGEGFKTPLYTEIR